MSRKCFNEFSYAEEAYLNDLVEFEAATPPINWKNIATNLNSRYKGNKTAKECLTYYRNRLQPGHLKTKLSKEDEDILLWAAHEERSDGKIRWTEIAKFFPNRQPRFLQNWYKDHLKKTQLINPYRIPTIFDHLSPSEIRNITESTVYNRRIIDEVPINVSDEDNLKHRRLLLQLFSNLNDNAMEEEK